MYICILGICRMIGYFLDFTTPPATHREAVAEDTLDLVGPATGHLVTHGDPRHYPRHK